jgi:hypothetical protein
MEDKSVASTEEIACAFSSLANKFLRLLGVDMTPRKSIARKVPHVEAFHAGGLVIEKCLQNGIDYGLISGTCTSSTSIARPSRQSS